MKKEIKTRRGAPAGSSNAQKGDKPMTTSIGIRISKEVKSDLKLIAGFRKMKLSELVVEILTAEAMRKEYLRQSYERAT